MRGDLEGDDALAHVVGVGQAQVLGGRHIAQEACTLAGGKRAADGSRDVVVAGGDVGYERAEHVVGSLVADSLLHLHLGLYLVERHVARTLDDDLHALVPSAQGQLAQVHELVDLHGVAGVGQTSRAAGVAQRDGDVVGAADLEHLVKVLVEGVLLARHLHPGKHEGAAARHDVHLAVVHLEALHDGAGEAAVKRNEINAVLGMHAHDVEPLLGRDVAQGLAVVDDGVVDGHRADDGGALGGELAAEGARVTVGGQVHDGLGAQAHGVRDLLHLHVQVAPVAAGAQVHVDLGAQGKADAEGREARVVHVGRDGDLALGHELAQVLGVHVLLLGDMGHLRGHNALTGGFKLSGIRRHKGLLRRACVGQTLDYLTPAPQEPPGEKKPRDGLCWRALPQWDWYAKGPAALVKVSATGPW